LVSGAIIPWWMILLLLLLCLCLVAAAAIMYYPSIPAKATEMARAATQTALADSDHDGLLDSEEVALGTDINKFDTDSDGLSDKDEVKVHGTDPKNKDTDGDTLPDGKEVNEIGTSPINPDTDGDGIPDNSDPSPILLPTLTSTTTITPTPTETPRPTQPPWEACPDTYPSRLHIGDTAKVSEDPPLANRLRDQPGTEFEVLGYIQPGEKITILEGPQCVNDWVWWKVESLSTKRRGWTAEGDKSTYWLVPVP